MKEAEKIAKSIEKGEEFDQLFNTNLLTWKDPNRNNINLLHIAAWKNNAAFLRLVFAEVMQKQIVYAN